MYQKTKAKIIVEPIKTTTQRSEPRVVDRRFHRKIIVVPVLNRNESETEKTTENITARKTIIAIPT